MLLFSDELLKRNVWIFANLVLEKLISINIDSMFIKIADKNDNSNNIDNNVICSNNGDKT